MELIENIQQTSTIFMALVWILIMTKPDSSGLPTWYMAVVLGAFAFSFAAIVITTLLRIWL